MVYPTSSNSYHFIIIIGLDGLTFRKPVAKM